MNIKTNTIATILIIIILIIIVIILDALRKIHLTGAVDQKHPKPPYINSLQVTCAIVSPVIQSFPPWLFWWT